MKKKPDRKSHKIEYIFWEASQNKNQAQRNNVQVLVNINISNYGMLS